MYEIAQKAMMVNISDAVAMNAKPKYALLGVAMPKSMSLHDMKELTRGFVETADQFNIEIIGGDTIANIKLDISVTIISEVNKPLLRSGMRKGDCIAYTGSIGKSAKALRYLLSGASAHRNSKFKTIVLRNDFIKDAAASLHCGMDISDGLLSDLEKLSKINRLGFSFLDTIPKTRACSGEEYEMLIAFSPKMRRKILRLAKKHRINLTIFAQSVRGRFKNRCKSHHF
jgi:thiamine-monophosphate kinase